MSTHLHPIHGVAVVNQLVTPLISLRDYRGSLLICTADICVQARYRRICDDEVVACVEPYIPWVEGLVAGCPSAMTLEVLGLKKAHRPLTRLRDSPFIVLDL